MPYTKKIDTVLPYSDCHVLHRKQWSSIGLIFFLCFFSFVSSTSPKYSFRDLLTVNLATLVDSIEIRLIDPHIACPTKKKKRKYVEQGCLNIIWRLPCSWTSIKYPLSLLCQTSFRSLPLFYCVLRIVTIGL